MRLAILAAPLAALFASAALADTVPEETATATTETSATKDEADKEAKTEDKAKANKRICRYIRADASSRRKTRVCMTAEAWREANRGN